MRRGPPPASPGRPGSAALGRFGRGTVLLVIGIVALAFNLRAAVTSLPPVFPELSASLRLSSAALAVLASVPVLCFAVFSAAGAPLSRRFGEERVLEGALAVLAVGLLLRGVLPGAMLFPGTALAAAGIALMNVLLPSLVKRRDPARAGWLIGIYLLSLSAGSILSSLIAIPVYRASGGSARLALGLWALPAIAAAVAWLPQWRYRTRPDGLAAVPLAAAPPGAVASGAVVSAVVPSGPVPSGPVPSGPVASGPVPSGPVPSGPVPSGPVLSGPVVSGPVPSGPVPSGPVASAAAPGRPGRLRIHRHALTWQVTAFFGLQSLAFYAALSWLPTMFRDRGASAGHAGNLLALMNFGGAVAALLIPVLAHRAPGQRVLVAATTAAIAVGLAGVWFAPLAESAGWILVLGFGQGASLSLAIYFTMARAPDPATAASLSAFAQGTGYLVATAGPLAVGFLHAATGSWTIPIVALLAVTGFQLVVGWQAARAGTIPGPRPAVPSQ